MHGKKFYLYLLFSLFFYSNINSAAIVRNESKEEAKEKTDAVTPVAKDIAEEELAIGLIAPDTQLGLDLLDFKLTTEIDSLKKSPNTQKILSNTENKAFIVKLLRDCINNPSKEYMQNLHIKAKSEVIQVIKQIYIIFRKSIALTALTKYGQVEDFIAIALAEANPEMDPEIIMEMRRSFAMVMQSKAEADVDSDKIIADVSVATFTAILSALE